MLGYVMFLVDPAAGSLSSTVKSSRMAHSRRWIVWQMKWPSLQKNAAKMMPVLTAMIKE